MKKRIAIICYKYSIEISPSVKDLCIYLIEDQRFDVNIIVDNLNRDESFEIEGCNLINYKTNTKFKSKLSKACKSFDHKANTKLMLKLSKLKHLKKSLKTQDNLFISSFKDKGQNYDLYFAIDIPSLISLQKSGIDPDKIIFWSLESTDNINLLFKSEILRYLIKCKCLIIQSEDRARDFNNFFNYNFSFIYFPVSSRGKPKTKNHSNDKVKIVSSGYFAEWSGIEPFLKSIEKLKCDLELVLHGHQMGTSAYVNKISKIIDNIDYAKFDFSYYLDEDYDHFLSEFDIGLVFYLNITGSPNFNNVIFSSGKIATYLRNNLPIITNINHEITKKPPFIFLDEFSDSEFIKAMRMYNDNRNEYSKATSILFNKYYNFDVNMKKIEEYL